MRNGSPMLVACLLVCVSTAQSQARLFAGLQLSSSSDSLSRLYASSTGRESSIHGSKDNAKSSSSSSSPSLSLPRLFLSSSRGDGDSSGSSSMRITGRSSGSNSLETGSNNSSGDGSTFSLLNVLRYRLFLGGSSSSGNSLKIGGSSSSSSPSLPRLFLSSSTTSSSSSRWQRRWQQQQQYRVLREVEAGAPEVGKDRFGETIDPSITNQVSARWGNMKRPPARQGLTGEDAESTAGSTFPGVHRHAATHTVFATVDAQSNNELPRKKSTVQPRARSAMDIPGQPNLPSGAFSMPAVGVGNLVMAQTFEGATATALSDSMKLPAKTDPDKGQSVSWNMITSRPVREAPGANAKPIGTSSWATTAPPVKSLALTGPANYRFALAQAGEAVAMSQIERTTSDRLPKNLREQEQEQNQQGKRRRLLLRWQQQSQSSHSRSSNNSVH